MDGETVVVVAAGEGPAVGPLEGALVIAADGGLDRARALGLEVAIAVGDFDSATSEGLARAERSGARVLRHPAEKDATDLELALGEALALGPERIVVVASSGGRLDHLLATCLALASPRLRGVTVDAHVGEALVHVVRGSRRLRGAPGELVTLLPVAGDANGVRTSGLRYPLRGETLGQGSSRGVSNVFARDEAVVSVERGVLLAIRPAAGEDGNGK